MRKKELDDENDDDRNDEKKLKRRDETEDEDEEKDEDETEDEDEKDEDETEIGFDDYSNCSHYFSMAEFDGSVNPGGLRWYFDHCDFVDGWNWYLYDLNWYFDGWYFGGWYFDGYLVARNGVNVPMIQLIQVIDTMDLVLVSIGVHSDPMVEIVDCNYCTLIVIDTDRVHLEQLQFLVSFLYLLILSGFFCYFQKFIDT